jgi:hypothetical protein
VRRERHSERTRARSDRLLGAMIRFHKCSGSEVRPRIRQTDTLAVGGEQVPVRSCERALLVVRSATAELVDRDDRFATEASHGCSAVSLACVAVWGLVCVRSPGVRSPVTPDVADRQASSATPTLRLAGSRLSA